MSPGGAVVDLEFCEQNFLENQNKQQAIDDMLWSFTQPVGQALQVCDQTLEQGLKYV